MAMEEMKLSPQQIAPREKLILAGLYLSKYDSLGLRSLGFGSFKEAFNVMGYAMGSRPATIKNYRDEFDPLYPNRRKGWHKRPIRRYCLKIVDKYGTLDKESFTNLVKSFVGYDGNAWGGIKRDEDLDDSGYFAKRLITGIAAERYFEAVWPSLPEFKGYALQNTTQLGCGYDFRLRTDASRDFLAVEVKGCKERTGNVSMTPKEYNVAAALRQRYYLFVVKNFQESPFHEIFQDPLSGKLRFRRNEVVTVQISWVASL